MLPLTSVTAVASTRKLNEPRLTLEPLADDDVSLAISLATCSGSLSVHVKPSTSPLAQSLA